MDDNDSSDYEYVDELVVIDFHQMKTLSDKNPLDGLSISGLDSGRPIVYLGNQTCHAQKIKLAGDEVVYGKSSATNEVLEIGKVDYHLVVDLKPPRNKMRTNKAGDGKSSSKQHTSKPAAPTRKSPRRSQRVSTSASNGLHTG